MKSIITILFLFMASYTFAQQNPEGSEFANTNFAFNPALTGNGDYLEAHALYRKEWTGFEESPQNLSIGLQYPFLNNNTAVGLHISQDQLGVFRQTNLSLNYAYHIPLGAGNTLSFGLGVHLSQYRVKESVVIATDENDPFFVEGSATQFQANAGAGFSFATKDIDDYNKSYFFLSTGANQIAPNDLIFNNLSKISNFRRVLHVFGQLGYRFQLDYAHVEPSLQINYVVGNVTKYRFHLNFEMDDSFWAGIALDSNLRFGFQGGIILRERQDGQIRIGGLASYGASILTQVQGLGYSIFVGYSFGL